MSSQPGGSPDTNQQVAASNDAGNSGQFANGQGSSPPPPPPSSTSKTS